MKVLITGGAGYIGSILTEHLLAKGWGVHVVDNLSSGDQCLFHFCANRNYEFTLGDVRDTKLIEKAVKDADVIVPLAALVGAPLCDREPLYRESSTHRVETAGKSIPQVAQQVIELIGES